ncbi:MULTISPECIES: beta strand repeat-containing protein [Cysteiniphilum]|uniref:beta strand repeat-containing protein n=1 Tax=Cysteiniphilum TaxID=2056696 RepID=UPI00177B6E88|nr:MULTISPECIES: hypothetical protein [Cysteiniphilum]
MKVYEYDNGIWAQKGPDLTGGTTSSRLGTYVSISDDGSKIAISDYESSTRGVDIYSWDDGSSSWVLEHHYATASYPWAVSLNADGTKIVVAENGAGSAGHIETWEYVDNAWTQYGGGLDGSENDERLGTSVAINADGTKLVAGAMLGDNPGADGIPNTGDDIDNTGFVASYKLEGGVWVEDNETLYGSVYGERFGISIATTPDGDTILIGVDEMNDGDNSTTGYAAVYTSNALPVITIGAGTMAFTEDQGATAIDNSITVTDSDDITLASAEITITNYAGTQDILGFVDQNGITGSYNAGVLTLTGVSSVANYQTALQSITYNNTSNAPNTTSRILELKVNDGSADSEVVNKTIDITAVNDAPVLSGSGTLLNINEDDTDPTGRAINAFLGSTMSDPDGSSPEGIAITGVDNTNGQWQYSTNSGSTWSAISPGVSDNGALLLTAVSSNQIRFVPNPNYNGPSGNISYRGWDRSFGSNDTFTNVSTNGGTTAFSATTETASLTVNAVNDAPVLSGTGTLSDITEDNTNPSGDTITDLLTTTVSDVDSGALEGIAIIGADNTNGQWQYTINNGTNWLNISGVSNSNAILLAVGDANTKVRFIPNADYNGASGDMTYRAWDQTSGSNGDTGVDVSTNGDTTAFSSATETASLTVNAVNDAPSITSPTEAVLLQATSITFDAGQGLIQIADVDAGSNDIELSISVTNGILSLSQDTGLTYQGGTNNNEALITVQGTVSEINSALTNLVYTPTSNFTGIATLTANIDDLGNDGTGGVLTDNQVINVNVKAMADVSIVEMNIDDPGFDESNFVTLLVNKNATIAAGTQLRVNINETDRLAGTVIAEYNGSNWVGQNGATVSVGQTSTNYETIIVEDPAANVENQGLIVHTTAHAVALVDASNVLELLSYKGNISFDYQGSTYLSTDIGLLSYSDNTDIVTTNSNVSLKRNLLNDDWQINRDSNFYAERGALPLWISDTVHEAIANPSQADVFISMFQYNPAGGPGGGSNNFVSIVVRDDVDFGGYKLVTDLADGIYSSGVNGTIIFDNTANVWSAQNGRSVESLAYATEGYTVYAVYGVDLNNTEGALVLLDNNDKPVDFISYGHEFEVTFGSNLYRSLIAGEQTNEDFVFLRKPDSSFIPMFDLSESGGVRAGVDGVDNRVEEDHRVDLPDYLLSTTTVSPTTSYLTSGLFISALSYHPEVQTAGISEEFIELIYRDGQVAEGTKLYANISADDPNGDHIATFSSGVWVAEAGYTLDVSDQMHEAGFNAVAFTSSSDNWLSDAPQGFALTDVSDNLIEFLSVEGPVQSDFNGTNYVSNMIEVYHDDDNAGVLKRQSNDTWVRNFESDHFTSKGLLEAGEFIHRPFSDNATKATDSSANHIFQVSDFIFADNDVGNSLQAVQITTLATNGTLKLNGSAISQNDSITVADISAGNFTFEGVIAPGNAQDTFDFKVSDGTFTSSQEYTMTMNIPEALDVNSDGTVDAVVPYGTTHVDNGTDFTVTTLLGNEITLPELNPGDGATIVTEAAGSLSIDVNDDGVDITVPSGSTVTNIDAVASTVTITTDPNGDGSVVSTVTAPFNSNAMVTDTGTLVTLDTDGDGTLDVTAPAGTTLNSDGTDVTATTAQGSIANVKVESESVITDNGTILTLTDNNGSNLTVPSGSEITDNGDGTFAVDFDQDGTIDVIVSRDSTVVNNPDATQTTTVVGGGQVTTQDEASAIILDTGITLSVNGNGLGDTDIASAPNDTDVSVAANGDVTATTNNGSVLNLKADTESSITDNGTILVLTDNNGSNLTVPSGSEITDNDDGTFAVDFDQDGTIDVIVSRDSTVVNNPDATQTTTVAGGGQVTTQDEASAIILDTGITLSVNGNGAGNTDIASAPNDIDVSVAANGDVTATTNNGSVLNLKADTESSITDNGTTLVLTDNNGSNLTVPSGSEITDNADGTFAIDFDQDGTIDVVVSNDSTVVNNPDATQTTTVAGGGQVTTQDEASAIILDTGTSLSINGNGLGNTDIASAPNDTDVSVAANGDVTATTNNGSVLNLKADTESFITDNGTTLVLTDNNGSNLTVPSGSEITDNGDGTFAIDFDQDGTIDVVVSNDSTVVNNPDATQTTTVAGGGQVTTQDEVGAIILDTGTSLSVNGNGLGNTDIASAPNDTNVNIAANGDVTATTDDGSVLNLKPDTQTAISDDGTTLSLTDNNGSNLSVSSGSEITDNADGTFAIDFDQDGTVDVVVSNDSTVVNNPDATQTTTVAGGGQVTTQDETGAIILDTGSTLSVNGNGLGNIDIASAPNDTDVNIAANGDVTATTDDGSVLNLKPDKASVISDDGATLTLTDNNGTAIAAPSGSMLTDNNDGTFDIQTADGNVVTVPNNTSAIIITNDASSTTIDLDGDALPDVTVPHLATVADNGAGFIVTTDPNGDGSLVSTVNLPDNINGVVTDDGTTVTVNANGHVITAPSGSTVTYDGADWSIDSDSDGTLDMTIAATLLGNIVSDGTTITATTPTGATIQTVAESETIVSDNGDGTIAINGDGTGNVDIVSVPNNTDISVAANGDVTATTDDGSVLNLKPDMQTFITENAGTLTLTDNNGSNLSVPSGSEISDNADGTFGVDFDKDGTIDVVVSNDSTVVNNPDVTQTTTVAGGGQVTTQDETSAIILDTGSILSVNGNGLGNTDIASAPNDTDVNIAANGDVTATTDHGSVLNLKPDNASVISDDGATLTLTDNNGTALAAPSGSILTDNNDGTFDIQTADGNVVTVPNNLSTIITTNDASSTTIDLDGDALPDVTVPHLATVADNGAGFIVTTDPNGDGSLVSTVNLPDNINGVVTDDGTTVTVNANGHVITAPSGSTVTYDGADWSIDSDSDGTLDMTIAATLLGNIVSDGTTITATTPTGATIQTVAESETIVSDNGDGTIAINGDGTGNVDIVSVPNNTDISVAANGDVLATTNNGSVLNLKPDTQTAVSDDGTTLSLTDNNGSNLSVSSGSEITDNADGTFAIDFDQDGTIDVVVSNDSTVVNNPDATQTTTVAGGGQVTTQDETGAIILDTGSTLSVNGNGLGNTDIASAPNDTDVNIAANGDVTATTDHGSVLNLKPDNASVISDDGVTLTLTDNNGTALAAPSGSMLTDNNDGTFDIQTADGNVVTVPNNLSTIITTNDASSTTIDLDGDALPDVTVPHLATVADNGAGFIVTTDPNGDGSLVSTVNLPDNINGVVTDDGTTVTVNANGHVITAPSGSTITYDGANWIIDYDGDGTPDMQISETLLGNISGTPTEITATTANGAMIESVPNSGMTVSDNADGTITVNNDGAGLYDAIIPDVSGFDFTNDGTSDFNVTTLSGGDITLPHDSAADMSVQSGQLAIVSTVAPEMDISVPSDATVVGDGSDFNVITANASDVTLPYTSGFEVKDNGSNVTIDKDGDGSPELSLPSGAAIELDSSDNWMLDSDGTLPLDMTIPDSLLDSVTSDGTIVIATTGNGGEIRAPVDSNLIVTHDDANDTMTINSDGLAHNDVTIPDSADFSFDLNSVTVNTNPNDDDSVISTVIVPLDSNFDIDDNGTNLTIDADGDGIPEITLPSGSHVTFDGTDWMVDSDGDGTLDMTIPASLLDNMVSDGTFVSATTVDGGLINTPVDSNMIVTHDVATNEMTIDSDGNGTPDATLPTTADFTNNPPVVEIITDPNGDGSLISTVTLPYDLDADVTDDGAEVSVTTSGAPNLDVTAPSGSSISYDDIAQIIETITPTDAVVTTPVGVDTDITHNPLDNTISIDTDGDGVFDVTAPDDAIITITDDGEVIVDIEGDGIPDVTFADDSDTVVALDDDGNVLVYFDDNPSSNITVSPNSNTHLTNNPVNGTVGVDFGGDGMDTVVPYGDTVLYNDDNTITVQTANGEVVLSENSHVAVSNNADGTISLDFDNDKNSGGANDVVVESGAKVIDNGDQTLTVTTPAGNEIIIPKNENVSVLDRENGLVQINFGNAGAYDALIPSGSSVIVDPTNSNFLLITMPDGDIVRVEKDSQSNVTIPAVNVYLDRSVLAVRPNAQGEYLIGGPILDNARVIPRGTAVDFAAAYAGFGENALVNVNTEAFSIGEGSIETPFTAEIQSGKRVEIMRLLSSDNIDAKLIGITPEQGQVEIVRSGNELQINFIANPNFSGETQFNLEVYKSGVLDSNHHFNLKVIQTPDVLNSDSNTASNTRTISNVNTETEALAVAKAPNTEVLTAKPVEIEQTAVKVNFKEALDQGQRVDVLREIASNSIKESLLDTASTQSNTQDMVKQIVRDAVAAQQNEVIKLHDVGKIAAGMINGALDVGSNTQFVVKGVVQQTIESGYNAAEVAEVLTQMILETDDSERIDVVRSIANESQLNEEHIVQVFNYLQAENPELAEAFAQEVQSSPVNPQNANNDTSPVEQEVKQGLLARLKAILLKEKGDHQGSDVAQYDEGQHKYNIQLAKAQLLTMANKEDGKQSKQNKEKL